MLHDSISDEEFEKIIFRIQSSKDNKENYENKDSIKKPVKVNKGKIVMSKVKKGLKLIHSSEKEKRREEILNKAVNLVIERLRENGMSEEQIQDNMEYIRREIEDYLMS